MTIHRIVKSSQPDDEVHHPTLAPGAVSFLTDFVQMATSRLLDNETLHFSIYAPPFSTGDIFDIDDDVDDLYVNIVVPPLPTSSSTGTPRDRNWTWPGSPFSPGLNNAGAVLDHELLRRQQHGDVLSAELDPLTSTIDVWTPHVVFRVATISVLMALTLLGNVSLIAVIGWQPSLRRKRVSVFLVNLAVGDLMVCFVTMTTEILFVAFGQWVLGAIACKLIVYGQIATLASTTFLLTAMSIDRYQVRNDFEERPHAIEVDYIHGASRHHIGHCGVYRGLDTRSLSDLLVDGSNCELLLILYSVNVNLNVININVHQPPAS